MARSDPLQTGVVFFVSPAIIRERKPHMKIISSFLVVSGFFLSAIPAVVAAPDCSSVPGTTLVGSVCMPTKASTGLSDTPIATITTNILNWVMAMIGIVAILMFVISGWMYLMAGGDEKKTEEAKNIIKYTVIGIAVALAAFIIVRLVANLLGASTTGVGTNI